MKFFAGYNGKSNKGTCRSDENVPQIGHSLSLNINRIAWLRDAITRIKHHDYE